MSETKFTPGPWKVSPRHVDFYLQDGETGEFDYLIDDYEAKVRDWDPLNSLQFEIEGPAPVHGRGDFNGPDALLVAAAPDLYAALDRCLPFIDDAMDVHDVFPESSAWTACRDAVVVARAALAKARGEK